MMKYLKYIAIVQFVFFNLNISYSQEFQLERTLTGHSKEITFLVFRSEDNLLISGDNSGKIIIWNLQNGSVLRTLNKHKAKITDLEFSNNGKLLASASYDGTIKLWDIENGTELRTYKNPIYMPYSGLNGNEPTFITFNKDDRFLFFGGYNMKVCKSSIFADTVQIIHTFTGAGITCGQMTPDKKFLAVGVLDKIHFIDIQTNRIAKSISKSNLENDYICELAFLPHNNQLAYWAYSGAIHFFDWSSSSYLYTIIATNKKGTSNIAFSYDSEFLVSGNDDSKTKIWNLQNKTILQTLQSHTNAVTCFAFSTDGNLIVTGSDDNSLKIWKKQVAIPEPIPTNNDSIPTLIVNRPIEIQQIVNLTNKEIEFLVWDRGQIDGDIISLYLNGQCILQNFELKREQKSIKVTLNRQCNYISLFAHNEGSIPPNTAAISIKDGQRIISLSLKSDLRTCGTLKLQFNQ